MTNIAIRVENLSKLYHIGRARQRHDTLRDALVDFLPQIPRINTKKGTICKIRANSWQKESDDKLWALKDIYFEVQRGEGVGVMAATARGNPRSSKSSRASQVSNLFNGGKMAISISAVVPVYNSEGTLAPLAERLRAVFEQLGTDGEIILVNDGSRDNSWQVITTLASQYENVRGLNLMRNYGQHNALLAGIRQARFPVTITIDDDLQHPPEEILRLLNKLDEGYDVVYGTPKVLPHSLWRNLTSRFTKSALAGVTGIKEIRNISAFRAFRTNLRDAFAGYSSPNLLLDVLFSWGTTKFASVPVDHHPRTIGESNYNFLKLFNQTLLVLTGFSTAPLRVASLLGFAFAFFGLFVLAFIIGRYLVEGSIPGFPFLASVITIFAGAQLFALGIIGEYLARIFNRSLERPTYTIKETVGGE